MKYRVRFAPSPTGALHIGGVRTALYNYLLAKKTGGTFILRIEDTDQERYVPNSERYIIDSLKWLGISPDEGVIADVSEPNNEIGPHAPYRQSKRGEIYSKWINVLLENGGAYIAFDTHDELDQMRKSGNKYDFNTRKSMKNSFTLSKEDVEQKINSGNPYVIRLNVPRNEEIVFDDIIRGTIRVNSSTLEDKVLMKSDGLPTYHFANVVDDYLMEISHVIRGEEWLPSAPVHVLLYRYLGFIDKMPKFSHLPLLLKPDGAGKLSKRDCELYGFPAFPIKWENSLGFRETGFLKEGVINFLALLGWGGSNNKEIFTMDELINDFSLEKVGKSGSRFDIDKARWINNQHIANKPNSELSPLLKELLDQFNIDSSGFDLDEIVELVKGRSHVIGDFLTESDFIFNFVEVDQEIDPIVEKVLLDLFINSDGVDFSDYESIRIFLHETIKSNGVKLGKVLPSLRILLTNRSQGPDMISIIKILGRDGFKRRIEKKVVRLVFNTKLCKRNNENY